MRRHISSGSRFESLAGYCRAVVDGRWVFVSGTTGPETDGSFAPDTARQTERALEIIGQALTEAGSGFEDVVRVRVYLDDRRDIDVVAPKLKAAMGAAPPANTTVVAPLVLPEMKVEIEVTALRAEDGPSS